MNLQKFSIVLVCNKPELVYNIPFKSSLDNARETFNKMAFSFNCSWFDKIYLVALSFKGHKSQILSLAYLRGDYEN